jgi:hypothetical protein
MRRSSFAAAAFAALALGACGSSSSHSSSPSAVASTPASTGSSTPAATGAGSSSTPAGTSTSSTGTSASTSAFKTAFAAQKASFTALGTEFATALNSAGSMSNATLATTFAAISKAVAKQQAALSQIQAPAQYQGQLRQLSGAFGKVAAGLSAIVADAQSGNSAKAKTDTEQVIKDAAAVKSADNSLSKSLGLGAAAGGSLAAFKAAVVAQNAQAMALGAALTQALKGLGADTNAQIAAVFTPLGASLTKEAGVLGNIQAPASLKAKYQAEIAAYRALAADVSKVGHDGATNASNAVARADGAQLATDALKLQKAEVALKAAVRGLRGA